MPYYPPRPDQEPSGSSQHKKIIRRIILCVSILLIVYGTARLVFYGIELASVRETTQELREIASVTEAPESDESIRDETTPAVPAETPTAIQAVQETAEPAVAAALTEKTPVSGKLSPKEYPNGYNVVSRIQNLRKKSQYIIGWITMDDLDEPVAMKDNSFFLNHDAAGKRNSNGAIFMDQNTKLVTRPYTILLYGHNMKTGAMFGNLRKYKDPTYCFHHRLFQFDTMFEEGQYVIFSVATIDVVPGKSRYFNLSELQSTDIKTRQKALKTLKAHGTSNLAPDVNAEDQVLLLITCVGDDDERLVVAARRIRDGENPDSLMTYQ